MKSYRCAIIFVLLAVALLATPAFSQVKGKGKDSQWQKEKKSKEGKPVKQVQESGSDAGRATGELPPGLERYKEKHAGKLPPGLQKQKEEGHLPPGLEKGRVKASAGGEKAAKAPKKKPTKKSKVLSEDAPVVK